MRRTTSVTRVAGTKATKACVLLRLIVVGVVCIVLAEASEAERHDAGGVDVAASGVGGDDG